MSLICPSCGKELKTLKKDGIEVDRCFDCLGVFLDHDELNAVANKIVGDIEYCTIYNDTFKHDDGRKTRVCPKCDVQMVKADFNTMTDIILDYCNSCKGFWLDGGELAKINEEIKRLNSLPSPSSPGKIWLQSLLLKFFND